MGNGLHRLIAVLDLLGHHAHGLDELRHYRRSDVGQMIVTRAEYGGPPGPVSGQARPRRVSEDEPHRPE